LKDAEILALDWDVPEFVLQMKPIRIECATYRNLDWDKEKTVLGLFDMVKIEIQKKKTK